MTSTLIRSRGKPKARKTPSPLRPAARTLGRRVVMLAYTDGQILDVTGPLEVFSIASRVISETTQDSVGSPPAYRLEVVAIEAGPVRMSSGLEIVASRSLTAERRAAKPIDTLMISGGTGTRAALADKRHIRWLQAAAVRSARVTSVCTGTFVLAEAGLLEGRRVTTHWDQCEALARAYPKLDVDPDPIFIRDGSVYTSAGVTAGIDLALALVEEDFGREVALAVARSLVVFLKRPGGQSQFSAQLQSQLAERDNLREVQTFIADHPDADLSVEALAERSSMSPRNFARVFGSQVKSTPARFVERSRVEAARRQLEETHGGVDQIADLCGFGSSETMRRAFLRTLRVGPAEYRSRFQTGTRSAARSKNR